MCIRDRSGFEAILEQTVEQPEAEAPTFESFESIESLETSSVGDMPLFDSQSN